MTIETYSDCLQQFEAAIQHNGIKLRFDRGRDAFSHRHRLYRARRSAHARGNTRYNDLYIQLWQGGAPISPRDPYERDAPAELRILLHSSKPLPAPILTLDDRPVTPTPLAETVVDLTPEEQQLAIEARKNLGLE